MPPSFFHLRLFLRAFYFLLSFSFSSVFVLLQDALVSVKVDIEERKTPRKVLFLCVWNEFLEGIRIGEKDQNLSFLIRITSFEEFVFSLPVDGAPAAEIRGGDEAFLFATITITVTFVS